MGAHSQHLGDDDLFGPMTASPQLGGPGPFVINLSSSTVPISLPKNGISVAPNTRVYQIKCVEDHCVRYRLRLGPFFTESQANAALTVVRDTYPAALTATANPADLVSFADIKFEPLPAPVAAAKPTPPVAKVTEPVAIPELRAADAVAPPPPIPTAAADVIELELMPDIPIAAPKPPIAAPIPTPESNPLDASSILQLLTEEVVPPRPPVSAAANSRSKKPPLTSLGYPAAKSSDLVSGPGARVRPKSPPPAPSAPPPNAKSTSVNASPPPAKVPASAAQAPRPAAAEPLRDDSSDLETTQTLRALTPSELESGELLRWFVVELSCSDRPFHPDALPNLDIFSAYRLYAVEAVDAGSTTYALRLGFFSDANAAQAIANYVNDHYQNPTVKRVSIAERERFKERRLEARKTVEATGRHAVIEITDQRYIRERRAMS
jgi:hypothetical protein